MGSKLILLLSSSSIRILMSVEPDYPLAKVVQITGIRPIKGANSIQIYLIPGWQVIDKIGAYSVGDLAIYCMINTVFPGDFALTSFLKGERLKTKKILGELSQGLLLPVSAVSHPVQEEEDLTSELQLRKWVPSTELDLYSTEVSRVPFPDFVPKTNEERVQNRSQTLIRLEGVPITITEKRDGTSVSYIFFQGRFLIGGRNCVHISPGPSTRHYFEMAERYDFAQKMTLLKRNIALQGEITGPKISGNRHGIKENQFHLFNIYSIDESRYLPWDQVVAICAELEVPHVRVIYRGLLPAEQLNVEYFLGLAEQERYENGQLAEGIVVKTDQTSFKAISNKYLLKYNL